MKRTLILVSHNGVIDVEFETSTVAKMLPFIEGENTYYNTHCIINLDRHKILKKTSRPKPNNDYLIFGLN